jgi:hypothetical protein
VLVRNRNFGLLFAARAISCFGTYLAPIAVAFAVLDSDYRMPAAASAVS